MANDSSCGSISDDEVMPYAVGSEHYEVFRRITSSCCASRCVRVVVASGRRQLKQLSVLGVASFEDLVLSYSLFEADSGGRIFRANESRSWRAVIGFAHVIGNSPYMYVYVYTMRLFLCASTAAGSIDEAEPF